MLNKSYARHFHRYALFVGMLLMLTATRAAFAASQEAGIVLTAMGTVNAQSADHSVRSLTRRAAVYAGDRITTGNESQLQLRMKDGAVVALGANAEFVIKAYSQKASGDKKDEAVLSLVQGGLRTITGHIDKSTYKLETPTATLGIRGTVYDVYVGKDGTTTVILREGAVDVGGGGAKRRLDVAGLATIVKPGAAPTEPATPPADVLDYLRGILPNLPDNVTWHSDGKGGAIFDLGDDIINIINEEPPGISADGEPPVEEVVDPCSLDFCCQCG